VTPKSIKIWNSSQNSELTYKSIPKNTIERVNKTKNIYKDSTMSMKKLKRRDFLKLGGFLTAGMFLPDSFTSVFAEGLEIIQEGKVKIVWIQGQSCSGCSVSLLNSNDPEPFDLLTKVISLVFHQTVGAAQGHTAMDVLAKLERMKGYILVIEGSIPDKIPEACMIDSRPISVILERLIPNASYVLAAGTCAAFGGIPGAEGNSTGAISTEAFMKKNGMPIKNRLLNIPSCPCHPKSIVGTLAYLAVKGYPQKINTNLLTPNMFYGVSTHDECPRYHYYERKMFAKYLGDPKGCLFKLGCLGQISYTNCPHRQWNGGVNWCIRAAAPCIGCSSPDFAKRKDYPFYRKNEHNLDDNI